MQQIIVCGRLGKDPEMRYTPQGTPVTSFSIPVELGTKDKPHTVWHRITAWNKQAETIAQYVKKGDWLNVTGTADVSAFTDREGNPKASLEVRLNQFTFGPKANKQGASAEPQADNDAPQHEDDLPF